MPCVHEQGMCAHPTSRSAQREYTSWAKMIARCYNPKTPHYARYGGRGIKVCDRWRGCFASFLADMGPRPAGTSIDRFPNNDGDYEPGNCRWATQREQCANRGGGRRARLLTVDGVTRPLTEWARAAGLTTGVLWARLSAGWSPERAIRQAPKKVTRTDISPAPQLPERLAISRSERRARNVCPRGHVMDAGNTLNRADGGVRCRACKSAEHVVYMRGRRAMSKEAVHA